jgi:Holliday junction resolvase-like predicted endonuclease
MNESNLGEDIISRILNSLSEGIEHLNTWVGSYWKLTVPRLFLALQLDPSGLGELIDGIEWREFEDLVGFILDRWGYAVLRNVRLRLSGESMEIDLISVKGSDVLLIEAKKWRRNAMKSVAESHLRKAKLIRDNWLSVIQRLGLPIHYARIYPIIVSWKKEDAELPIPIIDIAMLNNFIGDLDSLRTSLLELVASVNGI